MLDLLKNLFFKTVKKEKDTEYSTTAQLGFVFGLPIKTVPNKNDSGICPNPAEDEAEAPVPALDPAQPPDPAPDSSQPPVEVPVPAPVPALGPPKLAPPGPASDSDNPIINSINLLVDSIFKKDDDDFVRLKNYFFSIFTPPEDPKVDDRKSIALTAPSPNLTSEQEKELKETLEKCAGTYNSGDIDPIPPGPSDQQSDSTKTTPTLSQILKNKAEPPVYFGVGIKTELKDVGGQKFLKITDIFSNSNLSPEKQGDVDYTNQFITHLFCKLENYDEVKEYSINYIFNKFKDQDPDTAQEKFDEKIDQIFRDINQTSIKFKISAKTSQPPSAEVEVNKIIFEKTPDGAYKQKTMTPSTTTLIRDAKGARAGAEARAGMPV